MSDNNDLASAFTRLVEIMMRLRDPIAGCPWDLEQDFSTIAPYTIEEAYEVADAIDRGAMDDLKDELGDLLLQVVFHAQIAQDKGLFDVADVASACADKMIRRHPHVFGDATIETADAQTNAWEIQKASERGGGVLDGVAAGLPALMRAQKLQKRVARVGFDWPDASGPLLKIHEELDEISMAATDDERAEEIGDLLFAVVNYARHLGCDAEDALRRANAKFERRFNIIEATTTQPLASLGLDALQVLWDGAKSSEPAKQLS